MTNHSPNTSVGNSLEFYERIIFVLGVKISLNYMRLDIHKTLSVSPDTVVLTFVYNVSGSGKSRGLSFLTVSITDT